MNLLYFAPENSEAIKGVGIEYAVTRYSSSCGANLGPSGQKGVTFAFSNAKDDETKVGFYPDKQTWIKMGAADLWVGFYTDDPPKPEDLERPKMLPGYRIKLSDGNEWAVPVARAIDGSSALPQGLEYADGKWSPCEMSPSYTGLFEAACRMWTLFAGAADSDAAMAGEDVEVDLTDQCNVACQALAENYRLGPYEISLLGLLTTESQKTVLMVLVDWRSVLELGKRLAQEHADKESTGLGQEG